MMIRSTLMPISRAVSGSWAVACIARPGRVRLTKTNRTTMQTTSATTEERARWMSDAADLERHR